MAYSYRLKDLDDVYVEFNITPDFGTPIAPGEAFTITGQYKYPGVVTYGLCAEIGTKLTAYGFLQNPLTVGRLEIGSVSSGRVQSFTLAGIVPDSAVALDESGNRSFMPYLSFSIFTDSSHTSSGSVCASEVCRMLLLKHRIAPVIENVSFGDATPAQGRFSVLVQNFSLPDVRLGITTDPLDPTLTIVRRSLTIGTQSWELASSSQILPVLSDSGIVEWSLTVTDSAGRSAETHDIIAVLPWHPPRIETFQVSRYSSDIDDIGNTVYFESDDGEQVWITLSADIAPVNRLNTWNAQLIVSDGINTSNHVLLSGDDGVQISLAQDREVYTSPVSAARDYSFTISISDWFTATKPVQFVWDVPKAESRFNVEENGVAVGMYSSGEPKDKRFEVAKDYTSHFYGGISGVNIFYEGEEKTGGKWVDGKNIYRHVLIATSAVDGGSGTVGTLPADFETVLSTHGVLRDSVGSGNYRPLPFVYYGSSAWSVSYYINENGEIVLQAGSEYNGTKQLVIITEYTKKDDPNAEPGWDPAATRPLAAMTSNNSQGCVVSASSVYSSEYAIWKAFNKNYSNAYGWASVNGNLEEWLQIKLDIPLKDIVLTLYNRSRSTGVNGIVNATILGSNDGSEWVQIGVIEGRDGAASALKTVHECTNHDTAYQYVRLHVTKTNTTLVSVGELYIDGNQAV